MIAINGIKLVIEDIKRMWKSNILRVTVIGLIILPLIYSFLYLWAFWDPTSFLYRYPIAIVNKDRGIQEGTKNINLGRDLSNKLIENKKTNWYKTTEKDALDGISSLKYFLVLEIPNDFSTKAYSLGTGNPQHPQIKYIINEGGNMLGAKISRSIVDNVDKSLQDQLRRNYLGIVFSNVQNAAEGLLKAADASNKLAAGTDSLYKGSILLTNGLKTSSNGAKKLSSGLTKLLTGANQLENGIIKLNTIINLSSTAAKPISNDLNNILVSLDKIASSAKGNSSSIKNSINQLNEYNNDILNTANSIENAANSIESLKNNYLHPLNTLNSKQNDKINSIYKNINILKEKYPEIAKDPIFSSTLTRLDEMYAYKNGIEENRKSIERSLDSVNGNIKAVKNDIININNNIKNKSNNLSENMDMLISKDAINKINASKNNLQDIPLKLKKLEEGTNKLELGSTQLVEGLNLFSNKFTLLEDGLIQLTGGSQNLQNGLKEVNSGEHQLASKLLEGAAVAKKDNNTSRRIDIIASPVHIKENNLHPVPNNGTGFAPYFIALSLWVGSLVLFFVIDLKKVSAMPKRPLSYMVNKYISLSSVSAAQAILSVFILHTGLGINTVLPPLQLYLISIVIGISYTAILFMMLSVLGDNVGRFMAVVVLMLQLTSSSGSYPYQLEPKFFTFIHPYLPMTYAIEGLRSIISMNHSYLVVKNILILISYALVSLIILYLAKRNTFLKEIQSIELK